MPSKIIIKLFKPQSIIKLNKNKLTSQASLLFAVNDVAIVKVFAFPSLVRDPEALADADGDEVEPLRVLDPGQVDPDEAEVELLEEEHQHRHDDPHALKCHPGMTEMSLFERVIGRLH